MAELNLIGHVHQVTLVLNKCIDTMEQLKEKRILAVQQDQFTARLLDSEV